MIIIKTTTGEKVLSHDNKRQLICPYQQPILLPNKFGNGFDMQRISCGDWCPQFNAQDSNIVYLNCTGQDILLTCSQDIEPEQTETETQPSQTKLIINK